MALIVNLCWMLALGTCVVLTVRAECTKECALCLFSSLAGQQMDSGTVRCTLECGSTMDLRKLEICRNALTDDERNAGDGPKSEPENPEHILAKKYGGFMKRYGGFMMKKSSEDPEDASNKYDGFMKRKESEGGTEKELDILREILRVGIDTNEEGKELHKRYGGFMRRVGWLQVPEEPKPYALNKRWEEEGAEIALPEAHKRYGGFMD